DAGKDFVPLAIISGDPYFLVVKTDGKIKSFQDFIATAKANPGQISYGSTGLGSTGHVFMAMLEKLAGIKLNPVFYPSSAAVMTDILAGNLDTTFSPGTGALSNQGAGTVKIFAISTKNRSVLAPDVPTVAELGYPDYDAVAWLAV